MLALTVAAIALGIGSPGTRDSVAQVSRWTRVLYVQTFDFDRDAAWQRDHKQALAYVHQTDPEKLALDLKAVLSRQGMRSTAGAGAAYLMVLHNIEADKNLKRLEAAHDDTSEAVEDSLPDAFAGIAIQTHSKEAARFLVAMRYGDWDAESQSMAIHRLFLAAPDLVVQVVAPEKQLWKTFLELLPFGAWNSGRPLSPVRQVAKHRLAVSRGPQRSLYLEVLALKEPRP